MGKQVVSVQMFYSGVWNEVASDVFVDEQIATLWGQGSEGASFRPGNIQLTFNNATDKYRPTNPLSPLYGLVGRNTPCRVLVGGVVQMTGEATSYSPDQTQDFRVSPPRGRRSVDMDINGLLWRIGQSSDNLGSAVTRYDRISLPPTATILGNYPLEDGKDVVVPTNLVSGVLPPRIGGCSFGDADGPPGSDTAMVVPFVTGAFFEFYFLNSGSDTAGWTVSWMMRAEQTLIAGTQLMFISCVGGALGISINLDNTTATNVHFTAGVIGGVNYFDNVTDFTGTDWTQWQMCEVRASVSGGTTTLEWDVYTVNSTSIGSISGTFSGNPGRLKSVSRAGPTMDYSHVVGIVGTAVDLVNGGRLAAFNGWPGELAGNRFLRVLRDEEGYTCNIKGDVNTTIPMGPQANTPPLDMLEEMADTEDALIYDDKTQIGIVMRTRADRYNQTALALTFPGHFTDITENIDDLGTHNRVTLSNRAGSSYIKTLTTGPMSTQAPPNGVGLSPQTIDVNVDKEGTALPSLAGWYLNRGTVATPRYPSLVIDLVANSGLVASINALTIGDLINIVAYREDTIPVIVIGIAQKTGSHSRIVTLTTVPADLFNTAVYDGTLRRYDSASTTLVSAKTSTATSWGITTSNFGDVWSTTPGYQWVVAGELMTVTAMTAAAGTGPWTQTATVTRGVNLGGTGKAQSAGASIRVANPGRYAL